MPLVFCSCGDNSSESDVSSESSLPEVSETASLTCERKEELDSLLGDTVDRTLPSRNILYGLSYTYSRPSGSKSDGSYTDNGALLTDGRTIDTFDRYSWAGFEGGTAVDIIFDLGQTVNMIGDFEIGMLRHMDYGIGLAYDVTVSISTDGENYTELSTIKKSTDAADAHKYPFELHLQKYVSASHIKISMGRQESGWMFIDEISVYAYGSADENNVEAVRVYYPEFTIEKTEPVYVEKSESGATDYTNLALGCDIYVRNIFSIPADNADNTGNTIDTTILTDGKTPGFASWDSNATFRYTRGEGREIFVDLGVNCSVDKFALDIVCLTSWGVYPSEEVAVSVSADGVEWQGVASAFINYKDYDSEAVIHYELEADKSYNARYVRYYLTVRSHAAITELYAYGTKYVPSGTAVPNNGAEPVAQANDSYLTPAEAYGIDNILCTPICKLAGDTDKEIGMMTADEFMYYVGYYEDGVLKDTFFDSFVFSPANEYTTEEKQRTFEGWKEYITCQFTKERNLDALNTAAGIVGDELGIDNYKVNVFLPILRTWPTDKAGNTNVFGDIDGDGVNEDFSDIKDRKKCIRWMIDTQLNLYSQANTEHLDLKGFYWHEEVIFMLTDDMDEELIKYAADYVHSLGYILLWIPYYDAEGYNHWREYGVDIACLQPNYSFMSAYDEARIYSAATKARLYGMSVEIELSSWKYTENIVHYKQYLEMGVKYGYMDAVKVYYLGMIPTDLTQALQGNEYTASIYRDTYLFSNGMLDDSYSHLTGNEATVVNPEPLTVSGEINKKIFGAVTVDSDDEYFVRVTVSPLYGTLTLNEDGTFEYVPFKNFSGTDYFCVAAEFFEETSESVTVTVTVE